MENWSSQPLDSMCSTLFTANTGGYHMFAHLKLLLQLLGICICSFGVLIFDG